MTLTVSVQEHAPSPVGPALSHFQTEHFGRLLPRYGQRPHWVVAHEAGRLAGSWLLFTTVLDYVDPPPGPLGRLLDRRLHAIHGPVLAPGVSDPTRCRATMLDAAVGVARRERAGGVSMLLDPVLAPGEDLEWREAGRASGLGPRSRATYIADTAADPDGLFAALPADRRRKVRKAERGGVEVREVDGREGLADYHAVRADTARRNGLAVVPLRHFEDTWDVLRPPGIYHVFLAWLDGRVAAGQVVFRWNRYVYLSGVSTAEWAIRDAVPANDLLQWHVLRWAALSGVEHVDFVGADPASPDPKIRAIDAFKARWGTSLRWTVELVRDPSQVRSTAARVARRLRA